MGIAPTIIYKHSGSKSNQVKDHKYRYDPSVLLSLREWPEEWKGYSLFFDRFFCCQFSWDSWYRIWSELDVYKGLEFWSFFHWRKYRFLEWWGWNWRRIYVLRTVDSWFQPYPTGKQISFFWFCGSNMVSWKCIGLLEMLKIEHTVGAVGRGIQPNKRVSGGSAGICNSCFLKYFFPIFV